MDTNTAGVIGAILGSALSPIVSKSGEVLLASASRKWDLWKNRNVKNTLEEAAKILEDKGFDEQENLRSPSAKFASRFIDGASVEDQEDLQKVWAKLLANALDPNFKAQELHPSYFDIIKCLTPQEIKILDGLHDSLVRSKSWDKEITETSSVFTKENICLSLKLTSKEYYVAYENLVRTGIITSGLPATPGITMGGIPVAFSLGPNSFRLTQLGYHFISACIA